MDQPGKVANPARGQVVAGLHVSITNASMRGGINISFFFRVLIDLSLWKTGGLANAGRV